MIQLDILHDPICPWCLIGKRRLMRALEAHPDHPFAIHWHPFQLDPGMPRGGMDRADYLARKFGGAANAARVHAQVDEAARAEGLEIDWSRIRRTPNTLDAHRLVHWAGLEGRQNAAVDALHQAYFLEGRDIGSHEVLADIAGEIGIDREMIARLLASDADLEDIRARDAEARRMGVQGVPTFIIGGRHVVHGAQPAQTWEEIIDRLAAAPESGQ